MTPVQPASSEARLLVKRASWTLVDQSVVSLGNFIINVELARTLAASDYGKFALFLGAIFVFRAIDYSLISYPLSVRLGAAPRGEHGRLLANTVLLAAALAPVLALVLVFGIVLLGGDDILFAAVACYLSWQAQETTRRCLLADFRYRAAVAGDTISFIGQAVLIGVLSWMDLLTLVSALWAMSATFLAGALVHASKLQFARPRLADAKILASDYISLGKWSLLNYEIVLARVQLFSWTLAATGGAAATASFQAALNIANLMNPIIFGIGNAIPQAAARAHVSGGVAGAALVARGYILFGLLPILVICAGGLLVPEFLLRLLYGNNSQYLDLSFGVQALLVAGAAEYIAEMISKTLLGVQRGGLAFKVNLLGIVAAVFALPLIIPLGVIGACLALAIANLVRVAGAVIAIALLIVREKSPANQPATTAPEATANNIVAAVAD